jgi:hypothetical protein
VNEAVANQYHVGGRELIDHQVEPLESSSRTAMALPIGVDDCRNDVATCVVDVAQIDPLHPVEVAARHIKQGPCIQVFEKPGKLGCDDPCLEIVGSLSRARNPASPLIGDEDSREDLLGAQASRPK